MTLLVGTHAESGHLPCEYLCGPHVHFPDGVFCMKPGRYRMLQQCGRVQHVLERDDRAHWNRDDGKLYGPARYRRIAISSSPHAEEVRRARREVPPATLRKVSEVRRYCGYRPRHGRNGKRIGWREVSN